MGLVRLSEWERIAEFVGVSAIGDAVAHLIVDQDGIWLGRHVVIAAAILFLKDLTGEDAGGSIGGLTKVLNNPPVSRDAVREWFAATFPDVPEYKLRTHE